MSSVFSQTGFEIATMVDEKPTPMDMSNKTKMILTNSKGKSRSNAMISKSMDGNKKQLIVPYTLDNNDMRFATNQGFNSGEQFYTYLKDSFDALYNEGKINPKMMSVGLHCRLIGRPGRIQSLRKFLNYILKFDDVWICKRIDIAKHWIKNY